MSLVRLLAAGRSVMGLRKNVSPYRLTDQRLLPTFGSNKGSGPKPDGQPGACLSPSPVQGELRLERVKVVRNDLSDSDIELINLRPKDAAAEPKQAESRKGAFGRLGAVRGLLGFFGSNRT